MIHFTRTLGLSVGFILLLSMSIPVGYFVLDKGMPAPSLLTGEERFPALPAATEPLTLLINLDRAPERLKETMPLVTDLQFPYSRVSGVDGRALSADQIAEVVDAKRFHRYKNAPPRVGEIGCILSHIKAWQTLLASDFTHALVLEDDVAFKPNELRQVIHELMQNQSVWDIVSFDLWRDGHPIAIATLSSGHELSVYPKHVTSAGAYLINRKAAEKMLSKAFPIQMMNDDFFTRSWEFNLKFLGIENPRVVTQKDEIPSMLTHSRLYNEAPMSLVERIHQHGFKWQTGLIRAAYNLRLSYSLRHELQWQTDDASP